MPGSEPPPSYTNAITGPQSIAPALMTSSGQPPFVVAQTPGLQLGSVTGTASEAAHSMGMPDSWLLDTLTSKLQTQAAHLSQCLLQPVRGPWQ